MRHRLALCLFLLPLVLFVERDAGLAWGMVKPGAPMKGTPTARGTHKGSPYTGPTDRKELERLVDGYFARNLRAFHVPGAVFVLVKDGKIFFAKGYGYANLARRTPVIPDHTIFRICSVSKVFTATAVMQLVERKKIGLNDDVNQYLTLFKLPKTFPQPVTVADVLTHTGGFDERHIGRSTLDVRSLQPLGPYLASQMPPRVIPPAQVYSYSDFGYALAGYIVQAVSGMPFARYVDQHVFRPLGMRHSSFQQPWPPSLAADLATGYDVSGGGSAHPAPVEYFNAAPAAAMVGTATDVGHFMIAQLQGGSFRNRRILGERTVREMQQQHFSSYPPGYPTPGVAYGFGISYWNGQRMLDHSGALRGFTSLMTLLPAQRIGLFIAGNTPHDTFLFDLRRRFMDQYYPAPQTPAKLVTPPGLREGLGRFTGSYWSHEYSRVTIEKLRQLVNQAEVTASGTYTLTAHFWGGRTQRVIRIAPLLFGSVGDHNVSYWAFQQDALGRITHMVPGGYEVYDKIQWYETTQVQVAFIAAIALLALTGCLIWLVVPLVRRRRGSSRSRGASAAGWLLGLNSALTLFFLLCLGLVMLNAVSTQAQHYSWIEYGVPASVVALLCVPLVTTAIAAVLLIFAVAAWSNRYWSLAARLHYTVATLGALAFIPFLLYWNLLGFHF